MTYPSHPGTLFKIAFLVLLGILILNCNDTGTSPFVPIVFNTRPGLAGLKDSAIVPDTLVSDSGAVTSSYSINPALPAGLVLDPNTGLISGIPKSMSTPTSFTVTATGPNGTARAIVSICVGDSTHTCNINLPSFTYCSVPQAVGPGFMWTSPNVAFTPDTPQAVSSFPGIVTSYSVSPALPDGVTLNYATGVISGKPTDTLSARSYKVIATGPFGADTASIYLAVFPGTFPFALLKTGENNFETICAGCHQNDGTGAYGPPLLHSDYLMAKRHPPIAIQFKGLPQVPGIPGISGDTAATIYVNGSAIGPTLPGQMGPEGKSLDDSDLAGVITFVRNFFNGATDYISPAEAKTVRDSLARADTVGENCFDGNGNPAPGQYCIDTTDVGF